MKLLFIVTVLLLFAKQVFAHSPHDNIDSLILSPDYSNDRTIFIAISDHILKSEDGGFSWKELIQGIDSKHLISSIVLSNDYKNDGTIFMSTFGDGIFRSTTGGRKWKKINVGLKDLDIFLVQLNPLNNQQLLAISNTSGVFYSGNAGENWEELDRFKNLKIVTTGMYSKNNNNLVLLCDSEGNLYQSNNLLNSWEKIAKVADSKKIYSIAVSPSFDLDGTIRIGTSNGILESTDFGKSFSAIENELSEKAIVQIKYSPDSDSGQKIYAISWYDGMYVSNDNGKTWSQQNSGLTTDHQADSKKYKSPHFRKIAFSDGYSNDHTLFMAGFDGLFLSYDKGKEWLSLETYPVNLIKGMGIGHSENSQNIIGLATYGGGAYFTENLGDDWMISTMGLRTTRLSDVVFSPDFEHDKTVFSAAYSSLLKSNNSGKLWNFIDLREKSWRIYVSDFLKKIRLGELGKKLLSRSEKRPPPYPNLVVLSPDYKKDQTIFYPTRWHGLFKSRDGGNSSEKIWDSFGEIITDLELVPDYPNNTTLYASIRGKGIYISKDDGLSWVAANIGLDVVDSWVGTTIHQIKLKDINIEISPNFSVDSTLFAATSEGLYLSKNRGESWRNAGNLKIIQSGYITALAISPAYKKDKTIVISIKGKGLYISNDEGKTFNQFASALIEGNHWIEIFKFSNNYQNDGLMIAASDEQLFYSKNRGVNWVTVKRPSRYEDFRNALHYKGSWKRKIDKNYTANSIKFSDKKDDAVELFFTGRTIKWIAKQSPVLGIANVFIDGKYERSVDQYSEQTKSRVELFTLKDLDSGPHTIKIVVSGNKNSNSSGIKISHDAFDVFQK